MDEDLQNCCRICLDVEKEHLSILGDPTIQFHLKSCLALAISPGDDLPKSICTSCVTQLGEFYNFQLNARCSQDWLKSSVEERTKKCTETKTPLQPLPDSEYNSDSLLEFLNNTANIEEYLNNLGKEDIPSIVNLLDRNEKCTQVSNTKNSKITSPKKETKQENKLNRNHDLKMDVDVLDSDIVIVKEILIKETEPKLKVQLRNIEKSNLLCFACKAKFDNMHKLSQHMSVCDAALRTCIYCNMLFDSKLKMQQHFLTHNTLSSLSCNCGKQFQSREKLAHHHKTCLVDYGALMGCSYRCKECGQIFKERFQLYRHAREHVLKSEERTCDICSHIIIGKEALAKHKREEHKEADDSSYRCKVCSLISSNRKEMYLHVQTHTTKPESSRHLCESCGRSFATRASLLRHLTQHENLQEFQCNICLKAFAEGKLLVEHRVEHAKEIMCERCGQTVNSYRMDVHKCM